MNNNLWPGVVHVANCSSRVVVKAQCMSCVWFTGGGGAEEKHKNARMMMVLDNHNSRRGNSRNAFQVLTFTHFHGFIRFRDIYGGNSLPPMLCRGFIIFRGSVTIQFLIFLGIVGLILICDFNPNLLLLITCCKHFLRDAFKFLTPQSIICFSLSYPWNKQTTPEFLPTFQRRTINKTAKKLRARREN